MYSKTDGTFSTDADGNKTYTDAAGVTTTQCDEYNYTDENGNIITDGYGYIDPYTGLTSISDTMMGILHSSGRGSMVETSFLIRNFKIVLIIWANNYIIEE